MTFKYVYKNYFSNVVIQRVHIKRNLIDFVLQRVIIKQQVIWCIVTVLK